MQHNRIFYSPLHSAYNPGGDIDDIGDSDFGPNDWGMGFGLPHIKHVMQVYMVPSDHEQSPWRVAGMSMLLVTAVLAFLLILYYCVKRCCCKKKNPEAQDEENVDEMPSTRVNDEHRVSLPSELPSIDAPVKTIVPASFLESPTLNVSQPYQPEPEDLARMQEQMLAQLESTPAEWEMDHSDNDKKPFY